MAIRMIRKCNKCGEHKPIEDFPSTGKGSNQRARVCKSCKNAYAKQLRAQMREIHKQTTPLDTLRTCKKCGEHKPLADFKSNPACIGGKGNICKACHATYCHEWNMRKKQSSGAGAGAFA